MRQGNHNKTFADQIREQIGPAQARLSEIDFSSPSVEIFLSLLDDIGMHPEILDDAPLIDALLDHIIECPDNTVGDHDRILNGFDQLMDDGFKKKKLLTVLVEKLGVRPFKEPDWDKRAAALDVFQWAVLHDPTFFTPTIKEKLHALQAELSKPGARPIIGMVEKTQAQALIEDLDDRLITQMSALDDFAKPWEYPQEKMLSAIKKILTSDPHDPALKPPEPI